MRLSSSLKLGSLAALAACFAVAPSACSDGDGRGHHDGRQTVDTTPTTTPQRVAIDTDATLQVQGGQGVGVFVQYAAGGQWTVTTACDTAVNQTGAACNFDVFVAGLDPSTVLSNAQPTGFGDGDRLDIGRDGTLHLSTMTSTGLDGFTFQAPPGAVLELQLFLDGVMVDDAGLPQSRFVYWIGDKVLHFGAPSNPIDFAPSKP